MAEGAAKVGQIDAAVAAAKVTDPSDQSQAYAAVAEGAAKAGQLEVAKKAEGTIPEHSPKSKSAARRAISEALISEALARAGRFYEARVSCEPCERLDKLEAYTVILQEYTKRHPAKRGPQGTPVARP